MVADQNHTGTNKEPNEDGLSALRRLADLDAARGDATPRDKSPQTSDVVETIPDWLELLLAKYGEQASELLGIRPDLSTAAQPIDLTVPPPEDREASEVASLLEQMAAEAESRPRTERLATSVDWGEPTPHEDEMPEEQTTDWLDRISQTPTPPPILAVEEKTPDWPGQLGESRPEIETPPEPPEVPSRPVAEEEVPDWLQEIPTMPEPEDIARLAESGPPDLAPSEREVPDWLEDLGGYVPDSEGQQAEDTPYEPEDEVPDWMKELDMIMPSEARGTPGVLESEAPDWLKDLGVVPPRPEEGLPERQKRPAPPEVAGTEETEGELPDWLARLTDMSASEAEEAPAVEPSLPEVPPTPSPPKLAEVATQAEEEVPDWLRELESAEEEMPDWLRDLETAGEIPSAQPRPSEVSLPSTSEMAGVSPAELEEAAADWPDRLKEVEEGPAGEPPSPEVAVDVAAEEEAEIPNWLASLREETPSPLEAVAADETPTPAYPVAEPVEEPEWLAELRVTSKPDVLELDEDVIEAEEELPDWLAELRASQAAAEAPPSVLEVPAKPIEVEETGELEEFYPPSEVEFAVPELEVAPPPLAEIEPPAAEETEVLDWLAEIEAAALVPEYAEDETPPGEGEIPVLQEEVPDWLRQMPPADLTTEAPIPETEKETVETRRLPEWLVAQPMPGPSEEAIEAPLPLDESLEAEEAAPPAEEIAPAEIPAWLLELKPEEAEPAELRKGEAIEPEDVLAGIPGLLPLAEEEPEVEEEPISALRSRIAVPEVPDVEGARLFREVVTERPDMKPMETEPVPEARRGRIVETLVWAMVFIFLIAGILLALLAVLDRVGDFLGSSAFPEFFGSPLVIDPAPVNTFRAQVTRLPPDSVVVVAFDYGPATEAEMEPLAQIIVHDLLDHQARVIGVSLRPEGALMAQRLFGRFESEYPYTERTINLGFLPGQTAGVRSLAFLASAPLFQDWTQTLNDYSAWQDVNSLGDVALVVTIADSPLASRWWVEQIGPGTRANRPMLAAVSAAADPSVRPYYNQLDPSSGQLLGLLSGVTDAAAYENRLGQPERAVKSLAAQSVAHLGLIVIGLAGTVVGFRMQATRQE